MSVSTPSSFMNRGSEYANFARRGVGSPHPMLIIPVVPNRRQQQQQAVTTTREVISTKKKQQQQ